MLKHKINLGALFAKPKKKGKTTLAKLQKKRKSKNLIKNFTGTPQCTSATRLGSARLATTNKKAITVPQTVATSYWNDNRRQNLGSAFFSFPCSHSSSSSSSSFYPFNISRGITHSPCLATVSCPVQDRLWLYST